MGITLKLFGVKPSWLDALRLYVIVVILSLLVSIILQEIMKVKNHTRMMIYKPNIVCVCQLFKLSVNILLSVVLWYLYVLYYVYQTISVL